VVPVERPKMTEAEIDIQLQLLRDWNQALNPTAYDP
jgi:hypothetical protein